MRQVLLLVVGACLLLGVMAWLRPQSPAGPQTLTLEGRLPGDPNAEIRAHFPDLNYTASCRASELGRPGEPFHWTLQVPGKPGQVEMQTAQPHLPPVSAVPVAVPSSGSVQVSPPATAGPGASLTRPRDARQAARQKRRRQRAGQRRLAMQHKHREHRGHTK